MKKFLLLFLSVALFSCSNDDNVQNEPDDTPVLTSYSRLNYDTSTTPHTVGDQVIYEVDNYRLLSRTSSNTNSTYSYENGKISERKYYVDGNLSRTTTFSYNSEGKLIEYLMNSEGYNPTRIIFTHTADTIFGQHQGSSDGVNFDLQGTPLKIVLDANDNRTYFEFFDAANNEIRTIKTTYDANNNPVEQKYFSYAPDMPPASTPYMVNTYTYDPTVNSLYLVQEGTYGRETSMLLFHNNTDAVNHLHATTISPNAMSTFHTTFGGEQANYSFPIVNTVNEDGLLEEMDLQTHVGTEVFSRFGYQFNYE